MDFNKNNDARNVPLKKNVIFTTDNRDERIDKTSFVNDAQKIQYVLDLFSQACAHELKEPLRNIASFSHLLSCRNTAHFDEESVHYMRLIRQNIDRMHLLTHDLAYYVHLMAQKEYETTRVDLNAILHDIRKKLNHRLIAEKATLIVDPLPRILGVSTHFFRLFFNLIDNALKFCSHPPMIHIFVREQTQCWEIYVNDNGIGIEQDYHQLIFHMFSRLHDKNAYEGSGIGLAICNAIVQKQCGTIDVKSSRGKGSQFRVILPK